jgi:hypothetical protein
MDIDSNPIGVDYRVHIDESLKRCELLLAVIGDHWLGPGEVGARRIDDPGDLVRLEVSSALKQGIRVVPLLIDDTLMPSPEQLPEDLRSLKFRQAFRVDSGVDFHHHLTRLCNAISAATKTTASTPDSQPPPPPPPPSVSMRKERLRETAPKPVTTVVPPIPPAKPGEKSILAVIALVISIVSAGIFLLFFGFLASERPKASGAAILLFLQFLPLSLAIICGHVANMQIRRNPMLSGKGLALAALIIGYFILVPVALLFIAMVHDS